ncbi:MAG: hypothetical protein FJX73_05670 [Armatimonadetes bacterium]|nr:hypothetical protein [Armatimonadota bacterium]
MDPTRLLGPDSPLGVPSPYWFTVFFKVLGFTLHTIPMNLWFAGVLLAMLLRGRDEHARTCSNRLMNQMPILIALGINFGIIPLLFIQVAYYKVFFPATILMAWPWLSIILMLIPAYYGVYFYAIGLRRGRTSPVHRTAGWIGTLLFIAISFVFANGFSLMTNLAAWPALWQKTSVAGAPLGIALNVADPTLWPRWLMMFGLALTTTAAYLVVDAAFFAAKESDAYRRWVSGFALRLYTAGAAWFALMGTWYTFGTWSPELRQTMFGGSLVVLTALTALGPGLPWALILAQSRKVRRPLALATALAQVGVMALNAVSRQVLQNAELRRYLDVAAEKANVQWSPLIVFLITFAVGAGVIGWMIVKAVAAAKQPAPSKG